MKNLRRFLKRNAYLTWPKTKTSGLFCIKDAFSGISIYKVGVRLWNFVWSRFFKGNYIDVSYVSRIGVNENVE